MTTRVAAAALLIFLISVSLQAGDRVFDSDPGHACFVDLLRRAAWGLGEPFERAAFVVQQPDGRFSCVDWPAKHGYLEEWFHGLMPDGTVALVHTHPAYYPNPSLHDIDEATRVRRPIYVVSIYGVYRADPQTREVSTIAHGLSWTRMHPSVVARGEGAGVVAGGSR